MDVFELFVKGGVKFFGGLFDCRVGMGSFWRGKDGILRRISF